MPKALQDESYTGRLAPSPTGALHLGNARTFLIAWLRCRSRAGRLILRMEDLDHPKVKPHTVAEVYTDLRWLGLDWDEGPADSFPPDQTPEVLPHAPYVQSHRLTHYAEAFTRLCTAGHVYPCTCSRKDILEAQSAPHPGDELHYPNLCRGRFKDATDARETTGREPAWRFRAENAITMFTDQFHGEQSANLHDWSGDFVVARDAETPAYQLAVVVDDAAMGVTEVVRADDLLASTHRQLALYRALGLTPPVFLHVPLVVGEDGRRLAKRHGDTRLSHIRDAGTPPEAVVGWLAHTCGWADWGEHITPQALLERFTLETIPHEPAVADARVRASLGIQ